MTNPFKKISRCVSSTIDQTPYGGERVSRVVGVDKKDIGVLFRDKELD